MKTTNFYWTVGVLFMIISCAEISSTKTDQQEVKDSSVYTKEHPESLTQSYQDDRAIWQKPELVLHKLGDLHDKVLADIGAGTGYFSFRILPKTKKVIAVDIDPKAIEYLDSISLALPEQYKSRLETRLAQPDDPGLENNEIDVALLVNTYLYIDHRVQYFKKLKSKLKDQGEVLIIDYKMKKIPIGPAAEQRVPLHQVEKEMLKAGYDILESDDQSLSYQYILRAKKL